MPYRVFATLLISCSIISLWGQQNSESPQELSYVEQEIELGVSTIAETSHAKEDSSALIYASLLPDFELKLVSQEKLMAEQQQLLQKQSLEIQALHKQLNTLNTALNQLEEEKRSMREEIDMLSQIAKKLMTLTSQLQSLHDQGED